MGRPAGRLKPGAWPPTGVDALPPTLFAIEHVEARIDEWLWLEYRHAAQLVDRLAFTGVWSPGDRARLAELAPSHAEPAAKAFAGQRIVVTDPQAARPLVTADFEALDVLVVGGILGVEEFTGKTGELITRPHGLEARHLGKLQLPIDMAVLVGNLVRMGATLEDIELTTEVEVELGPGRSTELPYAYPVADGHVVITPGLVDYLRRKGA
jgi:ribosome biogenesis SPOUT family RNA methylase Rps3